MRVFHAKQQYPRISPWDLKTRIESKFSSTNCQMDALIVNYRFKFEFWRDGDLPWSATRSETTGR